MKKVFNKKNIAILLMLVAIPIYSAIADNSSYASEEKILLEHIKNNPSELTYIELSDLRLKYARQEFQKWADNSDKLAYEKAINYANSAAELNPKNNEAFKFLGGAYMQAPNNEKALTLAEEAYIKALRINDADVLTRMDLAKCLMLQGSFYQAASVYENMFDEFPKTIIGKYTTKLAETYIADGRLEWGLVYFNKLNKQHPSQADILVPLAVLYKNDNKVVKARNILKKIQVSPKYKQSSKDYATYLLKMWKNMKEV